jgi:pyruvate/2-oxoglutarate dehydrogenase complex dihydrolipoamide dehydrogenase (E3) component
MSPAETHSDLIVLGAGSAASACWFAARRLGKSVTVFEGGVLGGECPTFACVPTKALLHAAEVLSAAKGGHRFGIEAGGLDFDYARVKAWKDSVVAQTGAALGERPYLEQGVRLVREYGRFVGPNSVEAAGKLYTAERLLIATGASVAVPDVPGLEQAGFLTFKEAIDVASLPRSLFILGGGASGCEFADLFSSFGVRVTLCDRNSTLLHKEDPEAGDALASALRERGVDVRLDTTVVSAGRDATAKRLTLRGPTGEIQVSVDEILVASGKRPNLDIGIEAAGIEIDGHGELRLDSTLATTNPAVFAAGDAAGPYRFTHAASYQGEVACHNMFSDDRWEVDYSAMPRCVFTSPEVACVGMTEALARERGIETVTGRAEVRDADRALTSGVTEGFVKVVAAADGRLLGGVIVSPRAGEVCGELALAISLGVTARQLAATIHPFPTYSEALVAACASIA